MGNFLTTVKAYFKGYLVGLHPSQTPQTTGDDVAQPVIHRSGRNNSLTP